MSKISRDVPKAIAAFGEKQFNETGAAAVEVLRVKEAVLRKHFRELRGILYLVAVVSTDRVRVYFFNAAGVMVIGENLDLSVYDDIRKSSKLLAKYEKPRPLTPEELRIEATQDLRDALGKAIRRVSRLLSLKEPEFPDIFVTRSETERGSQTFGIQVTDGGELLFEESIIAKIWHEGLLLRVAYLLHFDKSQWKSDFASSVGNSIAYSLLKDEAKAAWHSEWKKRSKGSIWEPIVNHFNNHALTYSPKGYLWLTSVLRELPTNIDFSEWVTSVQAVHDSLSVSLGTEEYHIIDGFCKTLANPQQLTKQRYLLDLIHLSPRALCDPTSLGFQLSLEESEQAAGNPWVSISYIDGATVRSLDVVEGSKHVIDSIEYWLNLEDIFPLTGGPISHGLSVVRHALEKAGLKEPVKATFEATLEMKERPQLEQKEAAVLERLVLGELAILSNTLVGSPLIVRNLVEKRAIVLVPSFSHLGIQPEFLIEGQAERVKGLARLAPEATIFDSGDRANAILSAPTSWRANLVESIAREKVSLWPILSAKSSRRLIRDEVSFPTGDGPHAWTADST